MKSITAAVVLVSLSSSSFAVSHSITQSPHRRHHARDNHAPESALAKRATYSGMATWYDVGTGNAGACGDYLSPDQYVVALNQPMYGSLNAKSSWCGKTITISNGKTTANAVVADACPTGGGNCFYGSLDMSEGLFKHFNDLGVGEFAITWWPAGSGGGSSSGGNSNNNNNNNNNNDNNNGDDGSAARAAAKKKAQEEAQAEADAKAKAEAKAQAEADAKAAAKAKADAEEAAASSSRAAEASASRASVASRSSATHYSATKAAAQSSARAEASESRASVSASLSVAAKVKASKSAARVEASISASSASAAAAAGPTGNLNNFANLYDGLSNMIIEQAQN